MTEHTESNMLLAPLLTGILGAGLALLFAPRSGRETRARLRLKVDDMKSRSDDGIDNVRAALDKSIQEAQDLKQRLAETIDQASEKVGEGIKDLREDARQQRPDRSSVLSTWEEEV